MEVPARKVGLVPLNFNCLSSVHIILCSQLFIINLKINNGKTKAKINLDQIGNVVTTLNKINATAKSCFSIKIYSFFLS